MPRPVSVRMMMSDYAQLMVQDRDQDSDLDQDPAPAPVQKTCHSGTGSAGVIHSRLRQDSASGGTGSESSCPAGATISQTVHAPHWRPVTLNLPGVGYWSAPMQATAVQSSTSRLWSSGPVSRHLKPRRQSRAVLIEARPFQHTGFVHIPDGDDDIRVRRHLECTVGIDSEWP